MPDGFISCTISFWSGLAIFSFNLKAKSKSEGWGVLQIDPCRGSLCLQRNMQIKTPLFRIAILIDKRYRCGIESAIQCMFDVHVAKCIER